MRHSIHSEPGTRRVSASSRPREPVRRQRSSRFPRQGVSQRPRAGTRCSGRPKRGRPKGERRPTQGKELSSPFSRLCGDEHSVSDVLNKCSGNFLEYRMNEFIQRARIASSKGVTTSPGNQEDSDLCRPQSENRVNVSARSIRQCKGYANQILVRAPTRELSSVQMIAPLLSTFSQGSSKEMSSQLRSDLLSLASI